MTSQRPNVVVVVADDLGFSDLGCYGGEIDTPVLDWLAEGGVKYTNFYNTARCSPSRASLLTGRHPHETGIGVLTGDRRPHGYPGDLSADVPTIAETLKDAGYRTGMVGKWHLSKDLWKPGPSWPTRRGFDHFYGTISGTSSYYRPRTLMRGEDNIDAEAEADPDFYYTTAIAREGARFVEQTPAEDPLFLYVAFTAPHWPLHAPADLVAAYRGRFDAGWDELRLQRLKRLVDLGIVDAGCTLSDRDDQVPGWDDVEDKEWQQLRMEVYAAQVSAMDAGIGQIVDALQQTSRLEDTVVIFLSDNGASAEIVPVGDPATFRTRIDLFNDVSRSGEPVALGNEPTIAPGPEESYSSYGRGWANVSNTPYRRFKKWVHEGGIATPLILSWPNGGLPAGRIDRNAAQLTAIVPTILEAAGLPADSTSRGHSLLGGAARTDHDTHHDRALFWEHCGNAAIRCGRWKLARVFGQPWELYDVIDDPTELDDIAVHHEEVVADLAHRWQRWADDVGVIPFEEIIDGVRRQGLDPSAAER